MYITFIPSLHHQNYTVYYCRSKTVNLKKILWCYLLSTELTSGAGVGMFSCSGSWRRFNSPSRLATVSFRWLYLCVCVCVCVGGGGGGGVRACVCVCSWSLLLCGTHQSRNSKPPVLFCKQQFYHRGQMLLALNCTCTGTVTIGSVVALIISEPPHSLWSLLGIDKFC